MGRKQDKIRGILFISIGAFIVLSMINAGLLGNIGTRQALVFDGEVNDFTLSIVDHKDEAVVDQLYWVNLSITNPGTTDGSMYVQCSLLDATLHPTLIQSVTYLPITDNCVANEPFTKTAKVTLAGGATETVKYNFYAPDNVGSDNFIYCSAYEQCTSDGVDAYESEHVTKTNITIMAAGPPPPSGDECVIDSDCDTWMFWLSQTCDDGYCVETEDANSVDLKLDEIKLGDADIKAWAEEHVILLVALGILIAIIGFAMAFKNPKPPRY